MAKLLEIEFSKTYASTDTAQRAVDKVLANAVQQHVDNLRYMFVPVVGETVRYGVLFIGASAIEAHMHFHFNCVN